MSKGKISYMTKSSGLHYICILCPSNNWFKDSSIKWNLSIEVGGIDIDMNDTAKKSEISETLNTLKNLKKKFNSMKTHHAHQKVIVRFAPLYLVQTFEHVYGCICMCV
ncbi:transmembrane emp24 domain-containing protein [Plasmodium yoelii yoelii]|uniref:Transmembrane emp24 domain-containing protein n=1 Tax=Plasmodium yoelii yoelii TaxID=73239 RepID=A0AAE9WSF5_PLAYO|nr:transmembrane emp24 domain-containing protein [Plasmodium yoelii yoelii]